MSKKRSKRKADVVELSAAGAEVLQHAQSLLMDEGTAPQEAVNELADRLHGIAPAEAHEVLRRLAREGQEKALPLLRLLLSREDNGYAHAVVAAAGLVPSPQAAELLQQVAAQTADKPLSKEARRSLQRLRALGVAVDTFVPRGTSILEGVEDVRFQRVYASVIDGAGGRLLLVARRMERPGVVVARVYYNDEHGIEECSVTAMKKQGFLDMVQSSEESMFAWTEVPWDYAHYLLDEARQQNLSHMHDLPDGYEVAEEILGAPDESYEQPLIYQHVDAEEVQSWRPWLDNSPALLDMEEFESWWLDRGTAERYAAKWREAEESWLVLSKAAQEEREQKILHEATDEIIDETARARFKRRLEEMAYLLLKRHGETPAKQALAAALALAPDAPTTHANPFLVAWLERSVRAVAEHDRREERREKRLYVPGHVRGHEHEHEHGHEHEHERAHEHGHEHDPE